MKSIIKLFPLTALSLALALAQGPGKSGQNPGQGQGQGQGQKQDPSARRLAKLAILLDLTDTQKERATQIFTAAQTETKTLRDSMSSVQDSLNAAVKQNNTQSIEQLAASLGTTHGKIIAVQRKADAAFYALLTPAQQAKLDQLRGPRVAN
jgi:Spy/CpxP family protein refolding chaperone